MEILFSNHKDLDHYEKLHLRLKEVLAWLHEYLPRSKASRLIYTSIHRDYDAEIAQGRSGVHGLRRGADIVVIHANGKLYEQYDYNNLGLLLNGIWYYGDGEEHRVAFAEPHGTGLHLHLQARDGTRKRPEKT